MNHRIAGRCIPCAAGLGAVLAGLLGAMSVGSSGCQSAGPRVVSGATEAQAASLIGVVKSLDGTWEGKGPDGETFQSVFKVSSNGSAVREIMFPGTPHEMTNMYHMDGPTLVMTHYCAAGNQPRMRATENAAGKIAFKSDGVSNLRDSDDHYMAEMTLVVSGPNTIRQEWQSITKGKPATPVTFEMSRKGS